MWSAPSCFPISKRLSLVPISITGPAPNALATATPNNPIGPGPMTTKLSPAINPPNSVSPYIVVPAVTTKVASSSDISLGTFIKVFILLTANCLKPPSVVKPLARCPLLTSP